MILVLFVCPRKIGQFFSADNIGRVSCTLFFQSAMFQPAKCLKNGGMMWIFLRKHESNVQKSKNIPKTIGLL